MGQQAAGLGPGVTTSQTDGYCRSVPPVWCILPLEDPCVPVVLHWVVGICGIIDPSHVHSLLKFLEISIMHPQTAVERTVLSSVRSSFSSTQCALEDSPKLCDLTWIQTTAQRTVMMKKVGSGSSGTRTAGAPQDSTDSDSQDTDSIGEESQILKKADWPPAKRGLDTSFARAAASLSHPCHQCRR
jgi:hypothetical protein